MSGVNDPDGRPPGEIRNYAGPAAVEQLRLGAVSPKTVPIGYRLDNDHVRHVAIPRRAIADGIVVAGAAGEGKTGLLVNFAWQWTVGSANAAVLSRTGEATDRFARAIPDEAHQSLAVVAGSDERSVNLLDAGVSEDSPAFFAAIDAVTDALTSLLVVLSPPLRDAIREYVMVAQRESVTPSLLHLRDLARSARHGDGDGGPDWVHDASPDLGDRVNRVDKEAIDRFLESLQPLITDPVLALINDPDPDVSLNRIVNEQRPLVAPFPADTYAESTWGAAGRALVHGLWGAAREFEPPDSGTFLLSGDDFGPVLEAGPSLERLFGRVRQAPFVPVLALEGTESLTDQSWSALRESIATVQFRSFELGPEMTPSESLSSDAIRSLAAHECLFVPPQGDSETRRATVYPTVPPVRTGTGI